MKKHVVLTAILAIAVLGAGLVGCDNRSQTEKDIDKAASQAKKATADAQKKLGL